MPAEHVNEKLKARFYLELVLGLDGGGLSFAATTAGTLDVVNQNKLIINLTPHLAVCHRP